MCTNSFRVYRLWLCLLVAETVAIAADASCPRPLATGQVSKRRSKRCKEGADAMIEDVGQKVVGLYPGANIFCRAKSPMNITSFSALHA